MKSAGMIRKRIGKRIFTGAFCARSSDSSPLTLPQLEREVPHDLARRDAHRLALGDRAREHAYAGRVDAGEQVLERLDERQAHVLLLQRQPNLGRRAARGSSPAGETERLREAEAGLERHDEEVDQVGKAALDLLAPLLRARVDDEHRQRPSRARPAPTVASRMQQRRAAADERREPEPRRTRRRPRRGTASRAGARASSCTCRPRRAGRGSPCPGAATNRWPSQRPVDAVRSSEARAEPGPWLVVRGRKRAGEAVGADLLDRLGRRARRRR